VKNTLSDWGLCQDVVDRSRQRRLRQPGRLAGADHLAAEAKAAIDRADMRQLEQYAVGISVHDALDRTVDVVPDRIHELLGAMIELRRIRNELTRDGIVRITSVDQIGKCLRQAHSIPCGYLFNRLPALGRHITVLAELRGGS